MAKQKTHRHHCAIAEGLRQLFLVMVRFTGAGGVRLEHFPKARSAVRSCLDEEDDSRSIDRTR